MRQLTSLLEVYIFVTLLKMLEVLQRVNKTYQVQGIQEFESNHTHSNRKCI